jgi:hypothetical protein
MTIETLAYAEGFNQGIREAISLLQKGYKEHEMECPTEVIEWLDVELEKLVK